jgi:hypothetical protein
MVDLLLIFVPQWSPFQPPLSLPSLAAWLRRAGYRVHCLDANILFYHWLLSDECANLLLAAIDDADVPNTEADGYRAIIRSCREFRRDVVSLKVDNVSPGDGQLYVQQYYFAARALSTYLEVVSEISGDFLITPYQFLIKSGPSPISAAALEAFAENPPKIIGAYLRWMIENHILPLQPRSIGLSCIGEEQLPFTLLFGHASKQYFPKSPVFVGGTILPRIFERGVLKSEWLLHYFDIVVRNEGEKPCEKLLCNLVQQVPLMEGVPGIVYLTSDGICATEPPAPLRPEEVPVPDFDDLPLRSYISPEITLPVLSSRGCYWGKCEFCHHYMVYGDRYSAYGARDVVNIINQLSQKYQVYNFAFNDEAIPPKIINSLGQLLPDRRQSGYTFTGLIKFEKYYKKEHFINLSRVGFRSLYIGLESVSESVLALMKKPNSQSTILNNLREATEAGIWVHCFLFFGFPGETEADAQQTYDFVMTHPGIIGSFGSGTFVLEHNAPIQKHPERFKLKTIEARSVPDVSVYYDYVVTEGITGERAREWSDRLTKDSLNIGKYRATAWIPREFLLCMISHLTPAQLEKECVVIDYYRGMPSSAVLRDVVTLVPTDREDEAFAVNRMRRDVVLVRNKAYEGLALCVNGAIKVVDLMNMDERLMDWLTLAIQPLEKQKSEPLV